MQVKINDNVNKNISVFNYLASTSSSRADILCRLWFSNLPGSILKGFGSKNKIFCRIDGFIGIFLFPYLVLSSCLCCTLQNLYVGIQSLDMGIPNLQPGKSELMESSSLAQNLNVASNVGDLKHLTMWIVSGPQIYPGQKKMPAPELDSGVDSCKNGSQHGSFGPRVHERCHANWLLRRPQLECSCSMLLKYFSKLRFRRSSPQGERRTRESD